MLRNRVNTAWYLEQYPDVAASGMSAEEHYLQFGKAEGRRPCPAGMLERCYMRSRVFIDVCKNSARSKGGYWQVAKGFLTVFIKEGIRGVKSRILHLHFEAQSNDKKENYKTWIENNETQSAEHLDGLLVKIQESANAPTIALVMATYNTPIKYLKAAINSVLEQRYQRWQLCIADDASTSQDTIRYLEFLQLQDSRISVVFRKENGHISQATNSALELAQSDFVAFMDHDDELHPEALLYLAQAIADHPQADILFSDEDKIDEHGIRTDPYFKCDFNYELLLGQNMLCHLVAIRKTLVDQLGGLHSEYNGAQDHDYVLRAFEKTHVDNIIHIPRVLYHWRVHQNSTAASSEAKPYAQEAGRRAVRDHLERMNTPATVVSHPEVSFWHRVKFSLPQPSPSFEIIIPTRDRIDLMRMCITSIFERSSYKNFHITIVDNGSVASETIEQFREWEKNPQISIIRDDSPFNYSRLNNLAVSQTAADYVCLMNNDIEIITPEWIEEMVSLASRPGTGCVGARLWYPDDTLQHGGIILGIGGVAGHSHKYFQKGNAGYFGRAVSLQALSAVTAACLVIKRSTYCEVHGLDESLQVAFNDVDFCLRVREAGYRNIWTPFAEMYHHESASRGQEDNPEKVKRFNLEIDFMLQRWGDVLEQDPYYSPNLTLKHENFTLAHISRV